MQDNDCDLYHTIFKENPSYKIQIEEEDTTLLIDDEKSVAIGELND